MVSIPILMHVSPLPKEQAFDTQNDAFLYAKQMYLRLVQGSVLKDHELKTFLASLDQLSIANEDHWGIIKQVHRKLDHERGRFHENAIQYCITVDTEDTFPHKTAVPTSGKIPKKVPVQLA